MKHSYITVTDQFCGAGGSSIGATAAGAEVVLAMNHWKLAVETHNSNFPQTLHDCTDISACDPQRYPSTDILITSPECTNHSLAKGKRRVGQLDLFGQTQHDPAAERSRATMWDVPRFAEYHNYNIIIVENVVEARQWVLWDAWLHAMQLLGYSYQIVYLNSMFAHPTPQSRDRMYVVFHKRGNRAPNLDIRPCANCATCEGNVEAVQSWKNPRKPWGKYRSQYVYRCPTCTGEVTPYYYCAATAIDWSLPAPRIGDRTRPLKDKTIKRIQVGLEKFGRQPQLVGNYSPGWARPMTDPTGTVSTVDHHAVLAPPFLVDLAYTHGHDRRSTSADASWPTQTGQQTGALVIPPFLLSTNHSTDRLREIDRPLPTAMPHTVPSLVVPPFLVSTNYFRDNYDATTAPYPTQTSGNQYGVCIPPFLTSYYGQMQQSGLDQAVPTIPSVDKHALVVPPFIVSYYTRLSGQQAAVASVDEPTPTVPGWAVHYLAQPGETPTVEDCGFRMLQPHEIHKAMAFPSGYIVKGNQREQVKQYGNAVTPPVMSLLIERCVATLASV